MYKKAFTVCVATLILLTGCSKDSTNDNKLLQYSSLDSIYKNIDGALSAKYENLILPKNITIDKVDSLYKCEWTKGKDFYSEGKSIITNFLGEKNIDSKLFEEFQEGEVKTTSYNDIKNASIGSIDNQAQFFLLDQSGFKFYNGLHFSEDQPVNIINKIYYDRNPESIKNLSYKVNGKDYSVEDAIKFADTELKASWKNYLGNCDFRVKDVYVLEDSVTKDNAYYMRYEFTYEGVPLDEMQMIPYSTDNSSIENMRFFAAAYVDIIVSDVEHIGFIKSQGPDNVKQKKKLNDSFITLESALRIAENKLSGYSKYEISDIEMKYCKKNNSTEYSPMWCLIMEDATENGAELHNRKYINIDMLTGELCIAVQS